MTLSERPRNKQLTDGYKESTGTVNVEGGRVWYRRIEAIDDLRGASTDSTSTSLVSTVEAPGTGTRNTSDGVPLVVLHGGPGSSHLGMLPLKALAAERPVIFYDQLGCGNSDRPTDPSLWTVERYIRELATLREELGLDEVNILGHSWGTMLLCDYLLTNPKGVRKAVFSSPCLSAPRWVEDADKYREELPSDVQATLKRCEDEGTTHLKEYDEAAEVYMKRHVCRVDVPREEKKAREAAFGEEVYEAMWGPSEFHPTGVLKSYDRTNRLHEIQVPSLFCCGEYDEASPASTKYYHSLTPGSEFQVLKGCSHSPLREDPDTYLDLIRRFLQS